MTFYDEVIQTYQCPTFETHLAGVNLRYGYRHPPETFRVRDGRCVGCELASRQEEPCSRRVKINKDGTIRPT